MEVIAKNKADYISFSVEVAVDKYVDKLGNEKDKLIELRFIDNFKFMATSLDSLTRNLVCGKGGEKLFGFENYVAYVNPFEFASWKWLRHPPTIEIVGVEVLKVAGFFIRIVEISHMFIIC